MAKIEEIDGMRIINVDSSVGRNGVNSKDDVLAVQALLQYALSQDRAFRNARLPRVTGSMDSLTREAIRAYQKHLRVRNGAKVSIDGRIDRAKGSAAFGKKGLWTIHMLNVSALEVWLMSNSPNGHFISDLCRQHPAVGGVLGDPVGSLALSLESSGGGVGTLGLALE